MLNIHCVAPFSRHKAQVYRSGRFFARGRAKGGRHSRDTCAYKYQVSLSST
jgi:hypothetical protein